MMTSNDWSNPEQALPTPMKLVWIKRKFGNIYLGYRLDEPLSTNSDASKECYWYGNPSDQLSEIEGSRLAFKHHFSDITVAGWQYVFPPIK